MTRNGHLTSHSLCYDESLIEDERVSDEVSEVTISVWNSGFMYLVTLMAQYQRHRE